jgi:putative DNA primase/helicase
MYNETDASLPAGAGVIPIDVSPPPAKSKGRWHEQKALDPYSFPHKERRSGVIPCTQPNVEYLLKSYDITVQYDVIAKRTTIDPLGWEGSIDNADNVTMATVVSLAEANGMAVGGIAEQILVIGDENPVNPAANWIESKPWDGVDRLAAFYDTITTAEGFSLELRNLLMFRWLLSIVAAVFMPRGFKARGVLTLQGPQGIGKTAWVARLVSDPALREKLVKLDHLLDPNNKDSVLEAIPYLIVEIGELDSSFRKDVARLKGFITRDTDMVRPPYARTAFRRPRRTLFVATVNAWDFLQDETGNTRFWTLPAIKIDYGHEIDMQQLFAQLRVDFHNDVQWWLTKEEEALLNDSNRNHQATSLIRDSIMELVDLDRIGAHDAVRLSGKEILQKIGIQEPRGGQYREARAVMTSLLGEPTKYQGTKKWLVPLRPEPKFGNLP